MKDLFEDDNNYNIVFVFYIAIKTKNLVYYKLIISSPDLVLLSMTSPNPKHPKMMSEVSTIRELNKALNIQ